MNSSTLKKKSLGTFYRTTLRTFTESCCIKYSLCTMNWYLSLSFRCVQNARVYYTLIKGTGILFISGTMSRKQVTYHLKVIKYK